MNIITCLEKFNVWVKEQNIAVFYTEEMPSTKFNWEGDFQSYLMFLKQNSPSIMVQTKFEYSNESNKDKLEQCAGFSSATLTACGKLSTRLELYENSLYAIEYGMPKDGFLYSFLYLNSDILALQEEFDRLFSVVRKEKIKADYEKKIVAIENLATKIAKLPQYYNSTNRKMKDDVARDYLVNNCDNREIPGTRMEILDAAYRVSKMK